MRGTLVRLILSGVILLLPFCALAEGAVRLLECSIEEACDPTGSCRPDFGDVVFSMEPLKLDADGSGSYLISYDMSNITQKSDMEAKSFAGPFLWNLDREMHTLLANSETNFLWHRLSLTPNPESSIYFLGCEFTQ